MINSEYLNNLNNAQKEAVLYLDGPLLIVAGAGSGKTKVLTSRIAHIINEKKAFPNQILSVVSITCTYACCGALWHGITFDLVGQIGRLISQNRLL